MVKQLNEDLCYTPAVELAKLIRNKEISPVEVTTIFLQRIEKINPLVNAYCTVAPDYALNSAREAEATLMAGQDIGPLHGIPVSIKDVTFTKGMRTTFASKLFENYVPGVDSAVVERVKKAGAVILGKTNTPEFAAGGSTYNELFGVTRNPWDLTCNSGGSSGGAAAAVAAGMGPLAQGNDVGGSLRIPASFCGVVGLRPSPGRVPTHPNDLYWDSVAVEGPMARTVKDLALMLSVLSGPDHRSPIAIYNDQVDFLQDLEKADIKNLRVAWSDNLNLIPVDDEILEICRSAVKTFLDLGCQVEEDTPDLTGVRETALTLRGIRYAGLYQHLIDKEEFLNSVDPSIINNTRQGMGLTGSEVARAERNRSKLWRTVARFFNSYDLLLTPTLPIPPFPAETRYPTEINGKEMENYIDWVMLTYAFSIVGLPAITVPCGWTRKGMPVGLQIISRAYGEATVLQAAACFEDANPWADKRPSFAL